MLTRNIKIQLILFAIITLVGVSYVSAEYVGVTKGLFGDKGCTVSADFPDSGGIFSNAEVTYRGVTIGKVGKLKLIDGGVRVELKLNSCSHPKVPASAVAVVSDRSVIGEQYVNLVPPNGDGPFLAAGQVIPMGRNKLPVAVQVLLKNLDGLVKSVDTDHLAVTVSELGQAFSGNGPALARLLDSTNSLLTAAQENLPTTLALIRSSSTVLSTALDEAPALQSFSKSLRLLSEQLKSSDPDIRALLDNGPGNLATVRNFVHTNRTDLGVTLANLATAGELLVRHRDGLEQILELYPALAGGGATVIEHVPHIDALGLVLNVDDPPDCGDPAKGREGYGGTPIRSPGDLSPQAPNVAARCTAPASSGTNLRGSAYVPGGDPISASGGGVAYPKAATDTVKVRDLRSADTTLGDESWMAILTDALY